MHIFAFKEALKRRAELVVAIHEQVTLAVQEAVLTVRQIPGHLLHPRLVGIGRASGEVNAPAWPVP